MKKFLWSFVHKSCELQRSCRIFFFLKSRFRTFLVNNLFTSELFHSNYPNIKLLFSWACYEKSKSFCICLSLCAAKFSTFGKVRFYFFFCLTTHHTNFTANRCYKNIENQIWECIKNTVICGYKRARWGNLFILYFNYAIYSCPLTLPIL